MRRFVMPLVAAMALVFASGALAGNGGDHGKLDRQAINASNCAGSGTLIVNVTYGLYNDYDSNTSGGAWANDTIGRVLKIWDEGGGFYCAWVSDSGSFVTFDATSPQGTGTVTAGIGGVMQGGYYATITGGTLVADPAYATSGPLGSFDLQCTDAYTCPGAHPSFVDYVTGSYSLDGWGWVYTTPNNGTWVNQSSGNAGDITG